MTISAVIAAERSQDRKLSTNRDCSTTWVAQDSCPRSCPFYRAGCYAETGLAAIHTTRLNAFQLTAKNTPKQLAEQEAASIMGLTGTRPLRLHVVGDCKNKETTEIVAAAAMEYSSRHNKPVWTYTHSKRVPRKSWGTVSVLRSCQSVMEAKREHNRGYAAALVVPEQFTSPKAIDLGDGFKGIPCPFQTGKTKSCIDCKLCLHADKLHKSKAIILFAPDHHTDRKIKKALSNAN